MTEKTAKTEPEPKVDDLALIDDKLADDSKSEDELWNEIDAEEVAAANGDKPPGDTPTAAAASIEDQLDAGLDAGEKGAATPDKDVKDPKDADATDIWADASEGQRAAFDAAQDEIKKLGHSDRSQRGRVSTLQRQVADITKQLDRAAKPPGDKTGDADAGTTDGYLASEGWKAFAGEYPEVAGPLGEVVTGLQGEVANLNSQLGVITDDRTADAVETQTELLAKEHSDWLTTTAEDGFGPWLEDQPRHIKEAAGRNAEKIVDAREAADVVGRFKAFRLEQDDKPAGPGPGDKPKDQETGKSLSGKRKRQLETSSGARPKGAGVATGIPAEGSDEAMWDAWDKEDERQARQA